MTGLAAKYPDSSVAPRAVLSNAGNGNASVLQFYAGTLLSSIGSMTFTICLTAFILKLGNPIALVGITIAANRMIPLVSNLFWGDIGDRVDPRKLILVTEATAALLSVGLYLTWDQGPSSFWVFLLILVVRSSIVALQHGARARIVKMFGDGSLSSNSKTAVWLNNATHGAAIFGGVIGWVFVRYGSFHQVIVFDLLTFVIAGVLLWRAPISIDSGAIKMRTVNIFTKFADLYHYAPIPAILDLLLAVSVCGMGTLFARLAGTRQEIVPLFLITYGAAVWTSGYLCRYSLVKNNHWLIWTILALAFVAAFSTIGWPALTLPLIFIRDAAYWSLFHRYTADIQHVTPTHSIAGVTSARTVQVVIVLSLGEIGVGYWGPHISDLGESSWRAFVCIAIAAVLLLHRLQVKRSAKVC